jgi:hypothetical protein
MKMGEECDYNCEESKEHKGLRRLVSSGIVAEKLELRSQTRARETKREKCRI